MPRRLIDLTGQRFGRLLVLRRDSASTMRWSCRCDCGTVKSIYSGALRGGVTTSCGCYRREITAERSRERGRRNRQQKEESNGIRD